MFSVREKVAMIAEVILVNHTLNLTGSLMCAKTPSPAETSGEIYSKEITV